MGRTNGCLPVSCCLASLSGIAEGLSIPKERDILSRDFWRFLYMLAKLLFLDVMGSNSHLRRRFLCVTGEGVTEKLRGNSELYRGILGGGGHRTEATA